MKDIIIEPLDFSYLDPETSHVMIHVNVGKMPPTRVKSYLDSIAETTPVCKKLCEIGISFTVVPMRPHEQTVEPDIQIDMEEQLDRIKRLAGVIFEEPNDTNDVLKSSTFDAVFAHTTKGEDDPF